MEYPAFFTNGEEFFCIPDDDIVLGARQTDNSVEVNVYFGTHIIDQIIRYAPSSKKKFENVLNDCKIVITRKFSDYGFSI